MTLRESVMGMRTAFYFIAALLIVVVWVASSQASTPTTFGPVYMTASGGKVLATSGPLTLRAKCQIGTRDEASLLIKTATAHTAIGPSDDYSNWSDFGPGTVTITGTQNGANYPEFDPTTFTVLAADGTTMIGHVYVGINTGGVPNRCVFGGILH